MKTSKLNCGIFLSKAILPVVLCLGLLQAGINAKAAQITWGPPTNISGTNDVYYGGTTNNAYAYTWASSGTTISTVTFTKIININGTTNNASFYLSGFASLTTTNF